MRFFAPFVGRLSIAPRSRPDCGELARRWRWAPRLGSIGRVSILVHGLDKRLTRSPPRWERRRDLPPRWSRKRSVDALPPVSTPRTAPAPRGRSRFQKRHPLGALAVAGRLALAPWRGDDRRGLSLTLPPRSPRPIDFQFRTCPLSAEAKPARPSLLGKPWARSSARPASMAMNGRRGRVVTGRPSALRLAGPSQGAFGSTADRGAARFQSGRIVFRGNRRGNTLQQQAYSRSDGGC